MKYNLDDRPPLFSSLLYGLQWWIVSLPCVIIMGTVIGKMHFTDVAEQTLYMQKLFAVTGFTTIIQVMWGHKLPLVIGPASILLIGITASLSAGMSVVYTSIIVGGLFIVLLAFSGLLSKVRAVFTPRVITTILILIPFTLMPTIVRLIFGNDHHTLFNFFYAFTLIVVLLLCNKYLKGVWKSTTVLWGIIIGSFGYFCIFQFPEIATVAIGNESVMNSIFMDSLTFDAGTILAFIFCFFALIVNELGSIESVGQMLKADHMGRRIKYGVGISGLSSMLSGSMGVIGSVDYSMSTGVISSTGCASRYTLVPAGVGLIACAFLPQAVNILNHIPAIVMGTLFIYLMAGQLSSGLVMMIEEKAVICYNDGIVIGLSIMIAVLVSIAPELAIAQIPDLVRPILGNSFVMGVITVMLLEHIIFKKKKEEKQKI